MKLTISPSQAAAIRHNDAIRYEILTLLRELPHPRTSAQAIFQERLRHYTYIAVAQWPQIVTRAPCVYCGVYGNRNARTFEHIVPRSLGGTRIFTNAAGACRGCQPDRGNNPFLWFLLTSTKRMNRWIEVARWMIRDTRRQPKRALSS